MLNPQEKTTLEFQPSINSKNKMEFEAGNEMEIEAENETGNCYVNSTYEQ